MHNKKLYCLILLVLLTFISTPVYAKKNGKFSATVKVDSTYDDVDKTSYIKISNGSDDKYKLNVYYIAKDGVDYPAYCVEPETYRKNKTLNCELMTADMYPRTYAVAEEVYNSRKNGLGNVDSLVSNDILIRFAVLSDRMENGDISSPKWITKYSSPAYPSLRAAYYNTIQKEIFGKKINYSLGSSFSASSRFLLDVGDHTVVKDTIEKIKSIDTATIKKMSESTSGSITQATGDDNEMSGKLFTIKLVEKTNDYNVYDVTSKNEVSEPVVTGTNIGYEWVTPWDKTSGRLKIKKLKVSDCEGSFILTSNDKNTSGVSTYYCRNKNSSNQDFITIIPGQASGDKFNISFKCEKACEGCTPANHADEYPEAEINNCCDDGETKVRQAALNELFCDYSENGENIANAKPRCNAEEYITETPNSYCTVYCGTTVMYKIPGPTRGIADRAFEFSKKVTGFAGPLLNQYKRCRTVIKFDQWYADYNSNATQLVQSYEDNQFNLASAKMWEDMIKDNNIKKISATTITCTTKYTYDCDKPEKCNGSHTGTATVAEASINYYPTSSYSSKYKYANLDLKTDGNYTYSKIVTGTAHTLTDTNDYYDETQAKKYESDFTKAVETATSDAEGKLTTGQSKTSTSCSQESYTFENKVTASSKKAEYTKAAADALASYKVAVGKIKDLKDGLTSCGGEYTAPDVTKVNPDVIEDNIKFKTEPEMSFSYTAKFVDDFGKTQDQEIPVPFVKFDSGDPEDDKHCASEIKYSMTEPSKPDSSDWNENWDIKGWFPDAYETNKYKKGVMTIDDMKDIDSSSNVLEDPSKALENHKNDTYYADKKFTTDTVHHMTCKWHDVENTEYVIIPAGNVEWQTVEEIVHHEYEKAEDGTILHYGYTHYFGKTFANGKFETYYTLTNVGDGIIDDVIHEKGKTCSGKSDIKNYKGEDVNATCYFEIKNEFSLLLDCSRGGVISKDDKAEEICEKVNNPLLLEYKEVTPTELFPNEGEYGWNWKKEATGQEVLKKIQEDAAADRTYSPENLTYSFTLTPEDLREIKEYNKSRIAYGGYADFNLDCETPENGPAVKCKSRFIDAISGGTPIQYNGKELSLKTNNMNLANVRSDWKEGK